MSRKIGILTPFLWTGSSGINRQVKDLVDRLTLRGHLVTLIAPSGNRARISEASGRVRAVLTGERQTLFLPDEPYPRQFFAGETYRVQDDRLQLIAAPADMMANIDVLLESEDFDLLHLVEPFVPGLGWTALRHAGCPLVATFHANPEPLTPFWARRPQLRRLFDSLDAAIATSEASRDAAAAVFPGAYRIIPPGVDTTRFHTDAQRASGPLRVLFAASESRRKGLGVLLAALRLLEDRAADLFVDVCGAGDQERLYRRRVPPAFAGRVCFHGRVSEQRVIELHRQADVFCAPSLGPETAAMSLLEALASGSVVVASGLAGYDEVIRNGENGLLVPPRRPRAVAAALTRILDDVDLRQRLARGARDSSRRYDWEEVVSEVELVYEEVAARRRQALPRRRRQQREIFADFHIHSHHSKDCVMPVAAILERAREVGLDVVAITDHDTAAGGLEARKIAGRYGVRVIVGEEVKTSEGEVVGLFLDETIPGGMSFAETIAAIKRQGGIVYVPHPFDRLHTIPSPSVLRANVADIDVVEVFNSRLAFPGFNELAERFAQRYRIPAAAGSDSHVLPGIGTALCGMDDFEGAHDFVAALAESRVVRRPRSRIYLQSLKLLQTTMGGAAKGEAEQRDSN
ncbi:MAG: glycosyltransferase [Thermoleophilia bacterium]